MKQPKENVFSQECCPSSTCGEASRRDFLKLVGLGTLAMSGLPVMAGPFTRADFEKLVPADKKLSPDWIRSLFARGARRVYKGKDLDRIGMPIGGICSGQIYLGGDGRLWHWDIFNQHIRTGAEHYARPMQPTDRQELGPLLGFVVRIKAADRTDVRNLQHVRQEVIKSTTPGFSDVSFCGEYPIGHVEYKDPAVPVTISLQAFSPFIPLNTEDSALPATVLEFTVTNRSPAPVEVELAGWMRNVILERTKEAFSGKRGLRIRQVAGRTYLECSVKPEVLQDVERPPTVFADFEGDSYGDWKVEGEAFGTRPARGAMGNNQRLSGFAGKGLVNSYPASDRPQGQLTSPTFTIERPFICFLIGGGNHPGKTCINLIVDGKTVRTSTGKNTDAMTWDNWDVRELKGKSAHLEIIDAVSGGWGHIDIDQIEFRDRPRPPGGTFEQQPDFGTLTLCLMGPSKGMIDTDGSREPARAVFGQLDQQALPSVEVSLGQFVAGALGETLKLPPGQHGKVTFILAWHFPNLSLGPRRQGRHYATRFVSATAVAEYVAGNLEQLASQTRLWHDTWYDSTLPYWFLDRTMANTSILATSTCHWFADGRFYGWEGVGCCEGTCTHVWHYAHAVARLFPQLERDLRERTDFGLAFVPESGVIRFRAEGAGLAFDGQAGCILRSYREHQMSASDAFLRRNWPRIKKAMECLIREDADSDGIQEGSQHNTLDTNWFGPVAWLSGLYLAALRASEEMAREVGDAGFAVRCREIFDKGRRNLVARLFDGEYFINKPDPRHPEAINSGSGCEIDQVFGQSWAFQVGLGRVLPEKETRSALQALWRYNFTPDVGPYRKAYLPGRWYALAGEAGLLMCTFPRTDWNYDRAKGKGPDWAAGYFNECMTGFEYQAAGHMIWEGMVQEGLAITRAIHDRYHASRRNPWNEVECGDHYARAMASYGVFLAACGFEYHGPKGYLAFAPRLTPEDFRAPFTTAEGWGTFHQKRDGTIQTEKIELRWGKLRLRSLAFTLEKDARPATVAVSVAGRPVTARHSIQAGRLTVTLNTDVVVDTGQALEVRITS